MGKIKKSEPKTALHKLKNGGIKKRDTKKKKSADKYATMSLDDYLKSIDNDESGSETEESTLEVVPDNVEENVDSSVSSDEENRMDESGEEEEVEDAPEPEIEDEAEPEENDESDKDYFDGETKETSEEDNDDDSGDEIESHKKSLAKLKDSDPEFYKFLQEEDEFDLLKFGSDEEDEEEEADDDEVHKPSTELEVASDESDFEEQGESDDESKEEAKATLKTVKDHGVITQKMLKAWEKNIQIDKSNKTIVAVIDAFHAALISVSAEDEDVHPSQFKVEGSTIFNSVVRLCVMQLGPALHRFLGIVKGSKQPPHKYKKFIKIKKMLQTYLTDLTKILSGVTSANIQTVLLKHLHQISSFVVSFPNATKAILKRLIVIWGSADEAVRILAFFCILRITNAQRVKFLETVLKSMYLTYVKNSKFVSVNNLATINFMRRSLVEMFALDVNVAYQLVFMYVRQLAIHLRNAITSNKKENTHAVYNWQYVNSLKLWGNLLATTAHKPQLQQLVYPFVQVSLGVLKLVPTTQYFPLRFHVVRILIDLSRDIGVFIPVLPFLLEVLTSFDFNKKHQKVSMKPMQFTCLLRASKSQMQENGFKDAIVEQIYGLMLEYLSNNSSSIAFPDLSLICSVQIKQFLKTSRNVTYNRKMKQILEKVKQNADFIENERKKVTLNISDLKQIEGWEAQVRVKGTPLTTFFESWNKVHQLKKNKQATNNEKLGDYNLPTQKKRKMAEERKKKKKTEDDDGPLELFPSDSEDEEVAEEQTVKRKRGKRGGKGQKKVIDESGPVADTGEEDIVQDLDMADW